eukprot:m.236564 g.236564  ORF g.236564 m.236564 type:complete len:603 (-) comp33687_c3_seq1:46-1854(-)
MIQEYCLEYWNGTTTVTLEPKDRKHILDFYNKTTSVMPCYAYAYRPVYPARPDPKTGPTAVYIEAPPRNNELPQLPRSGSLVLLQDHGTRSSSPALQYAKDDVDLSSKRVSVNDTYTDLQRDQVFLGMVGIQDQPVPDIVDLVRELEESGIRFVFFSSEGGLESKSFASKLGLETGWNCHISLGSTGENDYDEVEKNARLPRGIDEIRPHLEDVDDVPLLVPLFSGCTAESSSGMIEIMQENEKVVCCIGSSMNSFNIPAFTRADMSIAFDPLRSPACFEIGKEKHISVNRGAATSNHIGGITSEMIAANLNTIPCSFCLESDDDFILEILIRESRRLSLNFQQCFSFLFFGQCGLSLVNLIGQLLLLPPIMTSGQILWIVFVPLPIIATSMWFTPAEPGIMDLRTSDLSRIDGLVDRIRQYTIYFILRSSVTVVVVVGAFAYMLNRFCTQRYGVNECDALLWRRYHMHESNTTSDQHDDLSFAQNTSCSLFVMYLCVTSANMIHRRLQSIHKVWSFAVLLVVLLQTAFFYTYGKFTSPTQDFNTKKFAQLPWAFWLAVATGAILLVLVTVKVRRHYTAKDIKDQQWIVLTQSTRLGMHSPK